MSCHRHEENKAVTLLRAERLDKMRRALIGKDCPVLREVIGEPIADRFVVLLVGPSDCGTCLDKAFALIEWLAGGAEQPKPYIIANHPNVGSYQLRYDYPHLIYTDPEDRIRRALAYYKTPVFLLVEGIQIVDAWFPTISEDARTRDAFITRINK